MTTFLTIISHCTGTPMKLDYSYKWKLVFTGDQYSGTIESKNVYDTEKDAYNALMTEQGDDMIYSLLNRSDLTDKFKVTND